MFTVIADDLDLEYYYQWCLCCQVMRLVIGHVLCVSVRACVYVRVREERKDGSGGELEVKDKNDVIQGRVTESKIQTKY